MSLPNVLSIENPWSVLDIPKPSYCHSFLATIPQLKISVTDVPVLQSTWNSETADTNSGLVTKSWTLL